VRIVCEATTCYAATLFIPMPRSKHSPAPVAPTSEAVLAEDVRSLGAQVAALVAQVDSLSQRIQILTQAVDDVREDLGLVLDASSQPRPAPSVMHITSMPKNALAPDFGERINRYTASDVPPDEEMDTERTGARHEATACQRGLWD